MCIEEERNDAAKIISLKNEVAKLKKRSRACVMAFHGISKVKSGEGVLCKSSSVIHAMEK